MAMTELIPLIEVGEAMGGVADLRFVIELADRQRAKVVEDWQGRPSVSADAAKKILDGYRAEVERERAAEEARVVAEAEAYRREIRDREKLHADGGDGWATGGFPVDPRPSANAKKKGYVAAREARARWEEKNPELDFETWKKKHR